MNSSLNRIRFLINRSNTWKRLLSSTSEQPLKFPSSSNMGKIFPQKLIEIVDQIEKLTLLEVSELNLLLKQRLNIPDTPMIAMGSMPLMNQALTQEAENNEPKQVKSSYTVKLTKFDEAKKVATIKEVKTIVEGLNLVQAKKFVESCPQIIKADISKDEAEKLKSRLEAVGAICSIE